jgi:hypothetical protein
MPDARRDGLMAHNDAHRQDGRRAASHYLQQLLLKPGAYRQSWERYVSRERRGTINQFAVAEVIARHLWSVPRNPADAEVTPHQCVPARSSWGNASKGEFHDVAKHDSVPALRVNVPDVRSTGLSYVMDGS